MRFRLGEDERLYETLKAEVYLRLLTHLPKTALSEVMRNIQKLEAMSYGEGIKQGMAVAALGGMAKYGKMHAISAHASFYQDAHTPLLRVEQALGDAAHAWAAAAPVVFPPQTLAEAIAAYGPTLEPADSSRQQSQPRAARALVVNQEQGEREHISEELDDLEEQIAEEAQAAEARGEDRPPQSPDLLDRIRTQIQVEMKNGWDPKTWPDVIMRLMMTMQIDAAFLDLQLAGPQGRAVLDQCGLHNIFPGSGVLVGGDGGFVGVRT